MFKLTYRSPKSKARLARLRTIHGEIKTPFFMPIATKGSIKNLPSLFLHDLKAQILLSNTYHLYLRPGMEILKKSKGLHNFMNWSKPILTDSGGYQVFSLSKSRKITEEGVIFTNNIDGTKHLLTPEKSIQIQFTIGSDIMMVLDECPPWPSTFEKVKKAVDLTTRWAYRCKNYFDKSSQSQNKYLFGIIQGGTYKRLRKRSIQDLIQIDFDGFAFGGLAVGEPRIKMFKILEEFTSYLPENKPRYLMGVGYPEEIVYAVKQGIDMFDCVIPTRHARHGQLFVFTRHNKNWFKKDFYKKIIITNNEYKLDFKPIDKNCSCFSCQNYSRAYIRHLFKIKEPLGMQLTTIHNLKFYLDLMQKIRTAIKEGIF